MVDPADRHSGVAVYSELYPSEQENGILPIGISTKITKLGYCLAPMVAQTRVLPLRLLGLCSRTKCDVKPKLL